MTSRYRRVANLLGRTPGAAPLLFVRLVVGVLFIVHGSQKYTAKGGLAAFEDGIRALGNVPAPALTAHVVPALEVAGGVLLVIGLITRAAALLLAGEMALTGFWIKAYDLHLPLVSTATAGVELDLAYLTLLVTVLLLGPGRVSADQALGLEAEPRLSSTPIPSI